MKTKLLNELKTLISVHEQIFHKKEMDIYVEQKIKEHAEGCSFNVTQERILNMLTFLVKQRGGDPDLM